MKPAALLLLPAVAFGLQAPIEGYGVVDIEWEAEISPGGPVQKFNGTIEKVHKELVNLNPNWDTDYTLEASAHHDKRDGLVERADFKDSGYFCGGRWEETDSIWIGYGINYLRRLSGTPSNGPGPGNCGRVSCSFKSAIWWCNDSNKAKTLGSFGDIADGASWILHKCKRVRWASYYAVSGQAFHPTGWNVIVRRDTEKC
ncbi:hypothetical protein TOPH_06106 [Tolypocladium ophioglossoides CBS 100239]|uniref:Ecp2 effector protein domain-containing protein n=1 Tax=Tolypocladium ophioglossoides (strain CBS 100239) TaxID=1163406 RepID=A0A0L0N5S3_TOLOC|nr:hypothetical protein TOPH_06106 [Tolypocladium ophioglossoides CBS 100239]